MTNSDGDTTQLDDAGDLSPHNKALYEAGKALLVESVSVGRDFCKFMTTTALSAIPLYLALLKFVLPKDYVLQSRDELSFLLPPLAFLVSTVFFVFGYFPQTGRLSLDIPKEIDREITETIQRRKCYSIAAFAVFALGLSYGAWQIVSALGTVK